MPMMNGAMMSEMTLSKTIRSEMAQVRNTASAATSKPALTEQSQTVAPVKASRAWVPAGNLRASAAEPIPAELRPGPKQALCILPTIHREGSLGRNLPATRIRWKDPRTGGARRISTEAVRGHNGDRRRAHHLDSDGHHGDRRRVHPENHDRHRDAGALRGDSRSGGDWTEADCSLEPRCPTERRSLLGQPSPRARQHAW